MNGIRENRDTVGHDSSDDLDYRKEEIEKKRHLDILGRMVVRMIVMAGVVIAHFSNVARPASTINDLSHILTTRACGNRDICHMKKVIITGASGMIGGHILQQSLDNETVGQVISIGRKTLDIQHAKLVQVIHTDMEDYSAIAEHLKGVDACFYCIGVYTGSVPDDQFTKIMTDYPVQFGKAIKGASPEVVFCLLSGQGADQTEKSRFIFARSRGKAENQLKALNFSRFHTFRPGYIYPVVKRKEPNFSYKLFRFLWPVLRMLIPNMGVASDHLAAAMLKTGLEGHELEVFENRDIRKCEVNP